MSVFFILPYQELLFFLDPGFWAEPWPFQEWKPDAPLPASVHDIWCRPHEKAPWALQLMVINTDHDQWISRRTAQIRGSLSTLGAVTQDGIPSLAPEIQLFYKAKGLRPKDKEDFATTLPALERTRRAWLRESLALVHPEHPWLAELAYIFFSTRHRFTWRAASV